MRYLKNQFRGRIGRTILEKKRQKSSHFYFLTPLKPSVYAVSGVWQSSCNRETYRWQDNLSKNQPKIFPFKKNTCFKCSIYKSFSGCASWTYRGDKNVLDKIGQKSSTLFQNIITKSLF